MPHAKIATNRKAHHGIKTGKVQKGVLRGGGGVGREGEEAVRPASAVLGVISMYLYFRPPRSLSLDLGQLVSAVQGGRLATTGESWWEAVDVPSVSLPPL